jgi:hypothetical protein
MSVDTDEIKGLIFEYILKSQGCKDTELESAFNTTLEQMYQHPPEDINLEDLLLEMVDEERIIEVSYVLPYTEYCVRSFYLPGKSDVHVRE